MPAAVATDGLELACWGDHFQVDRALSSLAILAGQQELLAKYGLRCWAISNHLSVKPSAITRSTSGIVASFLPASGATASPKECGAGQPPRCAIPQRCCCKVGVTTAGRVHRLSIWYTVAIVPASAGLMIDAGLPDFADRWNPILDVFDAEGVRFAHEVHPSEIAYDF